MIRRFTLLIAAAVVGLLCALVPAPAFAEPPTFSFTQDHGYCSGLFNDIGTHTWMRTYIRTQNDGTGHVVKSVHPRAWSEHCGGGDGSAGCGGNLNNPATANGRLRIYAVYAGGSSDVVMDRSFNLTDANDCDYLAGTTSDWIVNANEVHVRWDYDLKIDNASGDANNQSFMIFRKVINGGPDTWGCEFNGNLLNHDCTTAGPF